MAPCHNIGFVILTNNPKQGEHLRCAPPGKGLQRMKRFLGVPVIIMVFWGSALAQGTGASYLGAAALDPTGQTSSMNGQGALFGGIPQEKSSSGPLLLSLSDAIQKGLRYNLGALLSEQSVQATRGARLLALSQLLPRVNAKVGDVSQQVNLAAFGFTGFPGMKTIVGPFNVFDARASVTQSVLDFSAINRNRAADESLKAAQLSHENIRDMVAFICSGLYLQAVAGNSRIDAVKAQVATSQALYDLAVDQKGAGVVSGIEVLRAQVELQAQQQRLIVAETQFAKDKLMLARAIGLPLGQEFTLADTMPFVPISVLSLEESVQRAYRERPDYRSAQAGVRAAELERKSALAGKLPTVDVSADYGIIGQRPWQNHGTYAVATNIRVPLFTGGSVQGRVMEADALLRKRRAELEDLKGQIYYDIQKAFLDLKAAADLVQVAQSAVKLANEQVLQSQDRFRAGVTNNVEVVQAQEALMTASENHIAGLQSHNMAKLALARAIGVSEIEFEKFLRGKE
jgi:outer membrane protein TolC